MAKEQKEQIFKRSTKFEENSIYGINPYHYKMTLLKHYLYDNLICDHENCFYRDYLSTFKTISRSCNKIDIKFRFTKTSDNYFVISIRVNIEGVTDNDIFYNRGNVNRFDVKIENYRIGNLQYFKISTELDNYRNKKIVESFKDVRNYIGKIVKIYLGAYIIALSNKNSYTPSQFGRMFGFKSMTLGDLFDMCNKDTYSFYDDLNLLLALVINEKYHKLIMTFDDAHEKKVYKPNPKIIFKNIYVEDMGLQRKIYVGNFEKNVYEIDVTYEYDSETNEHSLVLKSYIESNKRTMTLHINSVHSIKDLFNYIEYFYYDQMSLNDEN